MLGASLFRDVLRVLRCAGLAGLMMLSLLILVILAATSRGVYMPRDGADSVTTLASSTTVTGPVRVGPITPEHSDHAQSFALALEETEDDGSANDPVHDVVLHAAGNWQVNLAGLRYSAGWQSWCRVPDDGLATQLARGPPV